MKPCLADGYAVVWRNPDPEYYVEGCGLVRLGPRTWLAAVPVVPRSGWRHRRAERSRVHLVRSGDGGVTWEKVSELPYYSAVPFLHDGAVHLFANTPGAEFRNDDLLLLRSGDGGVAWSAPVTLFRGHFWNCHTGMTVRDNRLYWGVDDLSFGEPVYRGPRVLAGDLSRDLLDPGAWRLSNPVPFPGLPDMIKDPANLASPGKYLEPNLVEVGGRLRVLCAVRKNNLCAVLDLDDDGDRMHLAFTQYHPMPCGAVKFFVIRDDVSGLFWAMTNPAANSQGLADWSGFTAPGRDYKGGDRRFLMLFYGVDGLNWFQAGWIARAAKMSQSFCYPAAAIDGEDLVVIARSNIAGPNPHDADCATFHRVSGFRGFAQVLEPETG